jgi:hypothetical protein
MGEPKMIRAVIILHIIKTLIGPHHRVVIVPDIVCSQQEREWTVVSINTLVTATAKEVVL